MDRRLEVLGLRRPDDQPLSCGGLRGSSGGPWRDVAEAGGKAETPQGVDERPS
jgi:hypothetical protein